MQKNPLFEFYLEIERTFHKLKRQRALQTEQTTSSMPGGEETQKGTLRDYVSA